MKPHQDKVLTTTYDNGKEFALHEWVSQKFDSECYLAHLYHSWERGLNENVNGLIRQYFPKGSDFKNLTQSDVRKVQDALNNRPRKCFDFQTPNYVFNSHR